MMFEDEAIQQQQSYLAKERKKEKLSRASFDHFRMLPSREKTNAQHNFLSIVSILVVYIMH